MAYEALYTRARPKNLAQLVGQDHISNSLARAINQDRLSHAYLLVGTRGTGKTSTARILARAINCDKVHAAKENNQPLTTDVIPCNECEACRSFKSSPDNIEFDAASNRSVEDVSKLLSTAYLAPLQSRFKTYIIDEVHMLSFEAVNSILKLIEEPPKNVIFFLATTEFNKVPLTIRSRCQILNFKLIPPDIIKEHLIRIAKRLNISIDDSAAAKIARLAKGSMRDSLTYFDQCYSMMGTDSLTVEMVENTLGLVSDSDLDEIIESAISKDRLNLIKNIAKSFKSGLTAGTIAEALITRLRDKVTSLPNGQENVYELAVYNELISQLRQAVIEMQGSGIPEVIFETALLKFVSIPLAALPKTVVSAEYEIKPIIQDKSANLNESLEPVHQNVQSGQSQLIQNKPIHNKIIDFPTNLSNNHLSNNEVAINESVENNEQMAESENINSDEIGNDDDNYFDSLSDLQDDDFVNLNNDSQDEDYDMDSTSNSDVDEATGSNNSDFNYNSEIIDNIDNGNRQDFGDINLDNKSDVVIAKQIFDALVEYFTDMEVDNKTTYFLHMVKPVNFQSDTLFIEGNNSIAKNIWEEYVNDIEEAMLQMFKSPLKVSFMEDKLNSNVDKYDVKTAIDRLNDEDRLYLKTIMNTFNINGYTEIKLLVNNDFN